MPYQPNIFNIPANYHFFESLFDWLEENFSDQFSTLKIFLPNRRSCREFQELFLQKKLNLILPKIKAISDISYEDFFDFLPEISAQETIDELLQIKVISDIDYLFFLSKEIQKMTVFAQNGQDELEFDQAFKIALRLKDLFDEIEREEIDLKKLDEIDDSGLSSHRQLTLDFLKNFHIQIKNSLLKKNIFFATSYQNFVIQKFTGLLKTFTSKTPIIIAGSTGSISFSKKLIKEISQQKNGYVILHALAENEEDFEQENHRQFFLNELIKFLKIEKKSVKKIANQKFILSDETRQSLLSLLMLPDIKTIKWQDAEKFLNVEKTARDLEKNFQLVEAKNEIEEAKIIAVILLSNYQTIKKAAIIANDSRLVELVKLELKNFNLPFNDSRNLGVFNSKLVNFLLLILQFVEDDFNSHNLLALLKHPLCHYSGDKKTLANFEIKILRQNLSKADLSEISDKIKNLDDKNLDKFFQSFVNDFVDFKLLLRSSPNLASITLTLIKTAENLSKNSWKKLLESTAEQIELFEFFEKLKLQNDLKINRTKLCSSFKDLLAQINFFEKSAATLPIQILSNVEARLLNYDLVIISSLNDGDFPQVEKENWLGKKIKKDLEIDRNLKKIGQNAADFCHYLSNKLIVLTRCKSRNGEALIASPFLLKLSTLCQKLKIKLNSAEEYFLLLKKLNSSQVRKLEIANPKPKIEFRPKKFSITEISKLISDPYSIYAKKILGLKELQKIDFEPSYAEFGSFVHKALEEFVKNPKQENFLKKSRQIFEEYFLSAESRLIWWAKFENIFSDFIKTNRQFFDLKNYLELPVKLNIGENLLSGKIDRIIYDERGFVKIFDYKTGQIPPTKNVTFGLEPQLTISALAIVEGMIETKVQKFELGKIESLNYWKLSSSTAGEIKSICKKNDEIKILISATKSGLERLFAYFSDEENGYISVPNPKNYRRNEYSHLARIP